MRAVFAILLLCVVVGCGPQSPADKRAQCLSNCADWSCDTEHQPAVCQACLDNCKGINY